ncbi:hypothetical protein BH09VER1_BH09VER1_28140 [soil metagenome]
MRPSRRAAFTLIELLASVAIIATLAALIGAATTSALDSAKAAKSISNLRQIATAFHTYTGENNDYFPRGYFYQPGQAEVSYINELAPYLSEAPSPAVPSRNIFIAPTSTIKVPAKAANAFIPLTYSVHGVLCPDTSSGTPRFRRSQVTRPTQVILIGDSAQNPTSGNSFCTFNSPPAFKLTGDAHSLTTVIPASADSDTSAGLGQVRYRTRGAAAFAMVDGHVALMKPGTITYANIIADR